MRPDTRLGCPGTYTPGQSEPFGNVAVAYREPNCQSDNDAPVGRPGATTARAHPAGDLAGAQVQPYLVSSNTSTEATLKPVKVLDGICEAACDVSSRLAVQPLCLD